MTQSTEQDRALASLRHLYEQMVQGAVKDSAQAKRIAEGLLSPAIARLEQAARRAQVVNGKGWGGSGTSMIDGYDVAAPVHMPEPAGWVDDGGMLFWTEDTPPDGENLYTEHQVRQLLAARGVK